MCRKSLIALALALLLLPMSVFAAEVDCDAIYCFTSTDFESSEKQALMGVCITALPEPESGTVFLGKRILQTGDILTAEQLSALTFSPLLTQQDAVAEISYLPIYENRVENAATVTISIRGKADNPPVAQDFSLETYKNLAVDGTLKVSEPEGQEMTYTLVRSPKRGAVELSADGTFVYTPKKNKVGVDSFTYCATDPAGNVSRVATVTVQILKPTDSKQYSDTQNTACRFTAEWMRHTGLFTGDSINGQLVFRPEETVSRGEFLSMLVKALDIPLEDTSTLSLPADTPQWMRPYLAAALRSGLTAGWPDTTNFSETITGAEAAVMLQNALDLAISQDALTTQSAASEDVVPAWAAVSLSVLEDNGIYVSATGALTRSDVSQILYEASHLSASSAGAAVYR
ncbi:MAG: S-layer homology domain-containing protein [Oscillospiraceae bacterium]|nr:S-layer homology domain-containing protein [Oscillospiraceae bacterium]